jgi:hypothetical protein
MPKYVIERTIEGAGDLTGDQLHDIAAKSNQVLKNLGPEISWLHSYVTGDKLYCVYIAPDADLIVEHARCGGFPCDSVNLVSTVIDPTTGE